MRKTLENDTPISENDQRNILSSLYHFFEMNVKNIKFDDYLKFHNVIPNPYATIVHLENEQNQPPDEMLILPSFETFMENENATHESVR